MTDFPIAQIRDATATDLDSVARMMEIFNRDEGISVLPADLSAGIQSLLDNPAWGGILIADIGGVPSAYALYTYGFDIEFGGRLATLNELFVLPRHRGKGTGHALIASVETRVRSAGARTLELLVRQDNGGAQLLYRRNDFQFDPRLLMVKRFA